MLMPYKCIQMSAEVRAIVLWSPSCLSTFVGEWNLGDPENQAIKWSTTSNSEVIYHSVKLQTQAIFNEINHQAEWGTLYYSMEAVSS